MNTRNKLNCYLYSNLICCFLSFNLLNMDREVTLVKTKDLNNTNLNPIYKLKQEETITESIVTTINNPTVINSHVNTTTINYVKPSYNKVTGEYLVNYAKNYLGLRYVSGGNSLTTGTDCSGFTKLIYKEFGINLGRTVNSQIYSGSYVSKSDLKPGDLVFYGQTNYASHVGIYMGNGLVIHQSNPRDGVKINSVNMMVYITARRVITSNVTIKIEENIQEENKKEPIIEGSDKETTTNNSNNKVEEIDKNKENNKIETNNKEEVSTNENIDNKVDNTEDKKNDNETNNSNDTNANLEDNNSIKEEIKEDVSLKEESKENESLKEEVKEETNLKDVIQEENKKEDIVLKDEVNVETKEETKSTDAVSTDAVSTETKEEKEEISLQSVVEIEKSE